MIWLEVADAIRLSALDLKWGVDGAALVQKLSSASPAQTLELAKAVGAFWRTPDLPAAESLRLSRLIDEDGNDRQR